MFICCCCLSIREHSGCRRISIRENLILVIVIIVVYLVIASLRELFYDRNAGDARVKIGSERQVATSPERPWDGVNEIGYTTTWILYGGTLQIWPCYRGIYSHKIPYTTVGFSAKVMPLTMKKLENLIKVLGWYTFYPKIGYTTIGILSAGTLQKGKYAF